MRDVAVIIPTYNRAAYLPAALDSVLGQTILEQGRRIEVAVVDDGSTDETGALMQEYVRRWGDPQGLVRVRYWRMEKQGVVAARNRGVAETTAPYVAFLDSDDLWMPRKLEKQLAILESQADVGLVHTAFRYIDREGKWADQGPQRLDNPCVGWCVDVLLHEFLVIFSSVVVRRRLLEEAAKAEEHGQVFDPRWTNAQDYDLVLRVARLAKLAYVPEVLTLYRVHGEQGAMADVRRAYGFHARVQMDFVRRYGKEVGVDEAEVRRRAARFLFGRAEAAYWRREMRVVRALCDLAEELGVGGEEFELLRRRARWPGWVYRVKDALDRWRRRS